MQTIENYVGGEWRGAHGEVVEVMNPATQQIIATTHCSTGVDVAAAVERGERAFEEWRRVPVGERIQYLFRYKQLLEENIDDLARTITDECGKTRAEALGELRRGIENVETACAAPSLMQGYNNENIALGIDEHLFRQPLGVVAAITPFNFPAMIPLWFLPYAIATGNSFILKPSEQVPLTGAKLVELAARTGLPSGVVQLVNGSRETVEVLVDAPKVRAISFVGSTPVARRVYARATAVGKRAQCQGGAKNPVVVLPDADLDVTCETIAESAFGCAGQRCLASSLSITVGPQASKDFTEAIAAAASERRVGYGWDEGVEMGPVISPPSRARILDLVETGCAGGARPIVDGRDKKAAAYESGNFVFPTVLDGVDPSSEIGRTEVFGPVLGLISVATLDEAIELINTQGYGNMACLFTSSGRAARKFRSEVTAGNVGINVGVAAPMAFYPFSGWKDSFFGDLHAQGKHAVEFYTQPKVVVERWPE